MSDKPTNPPSSKPHWTAYVSLVALVWAVASKVYEWFFKDHLSPLIDQVIAVSAPIMVPMGWFAFGYLLAFAYFRRGHAKTLSARDEALASERQALHERARLAEEAREQAIVAGRNDAYNLAIWDDEYRRGRFFSAQLNELQSYVVRSGPFLLRLQLFNNTKMHPNLGTLFAHVEIDGHRVGLGESQFSYEAPSAHGTRWGDAVVLAYFESQTSYVPPAKSRVVVKLTQIRMHPKNGGVEWEHPAYIREVVGVLDVLDNEPVGRH